jgi:flagellar hook-basal body complex protein FliE
MLESCGGKGGAGMTTIIRRRGLAPCGEQPGKGASVRATACAGVAYDDTRSSRFTVPEHPMNVTLKPFDFAQAAARAGLAPNGLPLQRGAAAEGTGFQQALGQALDAVNKAQVDATALQREVQLDNPTVSLEQTMVAMQKAQIGFQATLQVRNRLVQAYSDIMNMQV